MGLANSSIGSTGSVFRHSCFTWLKQGETERSSFCELWYGVAVAQGKPPLPPQPVGPAESPWGQSGRRLFAGLPARTVRGPRMFRCGRRQVLGAEGELHPLVRQSLPAADPWLRSGHSASVPGMFFIVLTRDSPLGRSAVISIMLSHFRQHHKISWFGVQVSQFHIRYHNPFTVMAYEAG